jgi:hypothetical protein
MGRPTESAQQERINIATVFLFYQSLDFKALVAVVLIEQNK